MATYIELNQQQAPCTECFFAFSNEQFRKGVKEAGLEGKKVLSAAKVFNGLYGTKEGIENFLNFYVELDKRIQNECEPQEVYDYEYGNRECDYVGDDTEAIKIVVSIFGIDRCLNLKRKYAYLSAEQAATKY